MTLNDDSFTWFLAWICLRVKPILFDRLPPLTAVLWYQQPEKLWKWPFLRHFMAKKDAEWWRFHLIFGMSISQSHTVTVWPFANHNTFFLTSLTWKTGKNAIITEFYGILQHCVVNSLPNVLYNFFWLLCNTYDWFKAKNCDICDFCQIA